MGDKSSFITERVAAGHVLANGTTGSVRGATVVRTGEGNYIINTAEALSATNIVLGVTPTDGIGFVLTNYLELAPGVFLVAMVNNVLVPVDKSFSFFVDKILG